jgi:NADH-quinone oxidoreductase subunit M
MNAALFANVAHGLITGLLFFVAGGIKERYGTADLAALGGGMLTRLPRVGSLLTFAAIASLGLPGLAGFWGEMLALVGAFDPAPDLSRPLYLLFMAIGGLGTVLTAAYFLAMLSRITHGPPPAPSPSPPPAQAPALDGHQADALAEERARPGRPRTDRQIPAPAGTADLPSPAAPPATTAAFAEDPGHHPARGPRRLADVTRYELAAWIPLVGLTLLFGLWPKALLLVTTPAVQAVFQGVSP